MLVSFEEIATNRREPRPRTDGLSPLLFTEIGADERQAAWDQERRAHTLHPSGDNELGYIWGQATAARSECKEENTGREDALASQAIVLPLKSGYFSLA